MNDDLYVEWKKSNENLIIMRRIYERRVGEVVSEKLRQRRNVENKVVFIFEIFDGTMKVRMVIGDLGDYSDIVLREEIRDKH